MPEGAASSNPARVNSFSVVVIAVLENHEIFSSCFSENYCDIKILTASCDVYKN